MTGWKVGYVAAPAALTAEFRKVHQFNVFTVNTPMQHGLAAYMADPSPHLDLPAFYQRKRDLFRAGLAAHAASGCCPAQGSYFQCVDYSAVSDEPEEDFCRWLTTEIGVAAIPLSAFYRGGFEQRIVRFCFAKKDETLALRAGAAGRALKQPRSRRRRRLGCGSTRPRKSECRRRCPVDRPASRPGRPAR